MGKKGAMPVYKTMDDYIADQSVEAQSKLEEIRAIVRENAPQAEEMLNYKVPAFVLVPGGKAEQQIMMAAYKKFIGFYPFPSTMEKFSEELKDYKQGKGSVQFPLNETLPKDLIARMVKYRVKELSE
jgi:uncharacterized protein YdhG (YjbR/CyaY superfamily)